MSGTGATWRIRVAKHAAEDTVLRPVPHLTEESARHIMAATGARLTYREGPVEKGGLVYTVEVEAETLEEALEKAARAARMAEEALLLY